MCKQNEWLTLKSTDEVISSAKARRGLQLPCPVGRRLARARSPLAEAGTPHGRATELHLFPPFSHIISSIKQTLPNPNPKITNRLLQSPALLVMFFL
jgi:hypothetical protein